MTPEARIAAAIDILDNILTGAAAEPVLTTWGRRNRFAGSSDRAAIRDLVFEALRRRRSLGWIGGGEEGRALMLGLMRAGGTASGEVFSGKGHAPTPLTAEEAEAGLPLADAPDPVRYDCPDWLWPEIARDLDEAAPDVLTALQSRAPVFLRVNRRAGPREDALRTLAEDGIAAEPHAGGPWALLVTDGARRVQMSRAFAEGLVELQDVASQAVVDRLEPCLQGNVLDYCAGGGGKALAMAAAGAKVTAHDGDPGRMKDLPARAARAGVEIGMTAGPSGQFDLVLCDAPCSGSGAWRRQPEAKWRLSEEALDALTAKQDAILDAASAHVRPGGHLGYATCSILSRENEARADAFLARHPRWEEVDRMRLLPETGGGDGFFLALFRKS